MSSFMILFILQIFASAFAFNITAITTCPRGKSVLECWQLRVPPDYSQDAGTKGTVKQKLGVVGAQASYLILPAGFDGGIHNAPTTQYVAFLSGLAHITLPGSSDEAYVYGGAQGLIIAADTTGTGHITNYPGDTETIALQIPLADGQAPAHTRLHRGACTEEELEV